MTLRTHRLTFPLTADQARELRAGDQVIIDGEITATAGIPTHERLLRCVDGAEPLPMPLDGHCLFHLGSFSRDTPEGFDVLYMNPTTSTRFNPHMPRLIRALSLHAVGGKGGLDQHSVDAMRDTGCVYLSFLGGGAALHSDAIREVLQVGWPDMLTHYRLVRLRVEGLGPLTVAIDAHGNSRYNDAQAIAQSRYAAILADLDAARTQ
ncbi:fumarate hydratase C-terminal domain-containing protein [Alcaligenaceae bacterium C4P045]|nr:fumarate hydratase C-terminal domain-containing protein [Alcaligenaceae bacterium C4P045]